MNVTKTDIANSISTRCNCPKNLSSRLVESTLEIVKSALESGEDVLISGFGKFCVSETNGHNGRNPIACDKSTPGAKRVVNFKCSPVLKRKLNEEGRTKRCPGGKSRGFAP